MYEHGRRSPSIETLERILSVGSETVAVVPKPARQDERSVSKTIEIHRIVLEKFLDDPERVLEFGRGRLHGLERSLSKRSSPYIETWRRLLDGRRSDIVRLLLSTDEDDLTVSPRRLRLVGMAHPQMFDDDDPCLHRVRELSIALPGSAEKVSHGRPAFHTKKVFAYYGGSLKVDGEWAQHPQSVVVLPDPGDRQALLEDSRVYVPAYLGPSGWIGVDLDVSTDWTEIAELLDASYRLTAPKRNITELDART